jgi:hypothetical protein
LRPSPTRMMTYARSPLASSIGGFRISTAIKLSQQRSSCSGSARCWIRQPPACRSRPRGCCDSASSLCERIPGPRQGGPFFFSRCPSIRAFFTTL